MRILVDDRSRDELARQLADELTADYVYMYPPRQAYRPIDLLAVPNRISDSLDRSNALNLYFHFPFCRQICAFCNLFTHVSTNDQLYDRYIGCLEREILYFAPWIAGKAINTVYLGGGTPSLLSPKLFERLFNFLLNHIGCDIWHVPEVAIEVSPETVDKDKFEEYRRIGINRVNLGVQSTATEELHLIGRGYDSATPFRALEIVQAVGFKNVCVDLIYGLEGQTNETWQESLNTVIKYKPETICAYALTLRPVTGFDARGYRQIPGPEQYRKYDYACQALTASGYAQETHVRWIRSDKGGYRQKANHWAMENILGFGAGARSYLWHIDIRNGYSARHRNRAFREYLDRVEERGFGVADGFLMDDDERRRKAVILGLLKLDREWYRRKFDADPVSDFPEEFDVLYGLDLLADVGKYIQLTAFGTRHRDLIVQRFFSRRVCDLLHEFNYDE